MDQLGMTQNNKENFYEWGFLLLLHSWLVALIGPLREIAPLTGGLTARYAGGK